MSDAKHTPEPLKVLDPGGYAPVWISTEDETLLAKMHEGSADGPAPPCDQLLADAHRWVACVNACKGIDPATIPTLLAQRESLKKTCRESASAIRDELRRGRNLALQTVEQHLRRIGESTRLTS